METTAAEMASRPDWAGELPAPRAFGRSPADLDIDFRMADRVSLAVAVLNQCCDGEALSVRDRGSAVWSLPVGERARRLLEVAALTLDQDRLPLELTCAAPACGATFEILLPLRGLPAGLGRGEVTVDLAGQGAVSLRLPTGRDQALWRQLAFENQPKAIAGMLASLAIPPNHALPCLKEDQLARIDSLMQSADPLISFTVATACPHCRCEAFIPVDLEAAALDCLRKCRAGILEEVHHFGKCYGWSESETLAVPASRRAEYRRLTETEFHRPL